MNKHTKQYIFISIILVSIITNNAYTNEIFEYEWHASPSEYKQETYTPIEPVNIELLELDTPQTTNPASVLLQRKYNIYMIAGWENNEAQLILETLDQLYPKNIRFESNWQISIWSKSNIEIEEDIEITSNQNILFVNISQQAINDSSTMFAKIDGIKAKVYNKRVHRAIIQYIYHIEGRRKLQNILRDRFGIETKYIDYKELTKNTTKDENIIFDQFKDQELIYLINILEEYPGGMLKTPGLKYMIRRKDGLTHPLYPTAPAVAWTQTGYIEFMSSAFDNTSREFIYRLILHEKAHFLWSHLFDETLKKDWITLGQWFENPKSSSGWSTHDELRFVSDYAHNVNPNEDMAESISFYIINPIKLQTNAPKKYKFIQNRIMHGTKYISKIREDLTFRVYNLYPDYTYPAKIKRIYIKITGAPKEDKNIYVEIEINSQSILDNVQTAYIRMYNDKDQMHDLAWFNKSDDGKILTYNGKISKYKASGFWHCNWLRIVDTSGNKRITHPPNIGWLFYINNPLEDLEAPIYIPGSESLTLESIENNNEYNIYNVLFTAKIDDNNSDKGLGILIRLNNPNPNKYQKQSWGHFDIETKISKTYFKIYDYDTNGIWQIHEILLQDIAGNRKYYRLDEIDQSIYVNTQKEDTTIPKIDINKIDITATPTNIEYPNGETHVQIKIFLKEKESGIYLAFFYLTDPLGRKTRYQFYYYDIISDTEDESEYIKHTVNILLPIGSSPGIWGLHEISLEDRAGNQNNYDFTTLYRIEIDSTVAKAPSIIQTKLLNNYPNPANPETWIPYQLSTPSNVTLKIYDITGKTIKTILLGHKQQGTYISQNKAAYWDGTNEANEKIASGTYIYHLQTNDYSQMKKLIILK